MQKKFYTLTALLLVFVQAIFAAAPTNPASNITFSSIEGGSVRVTWTSGNGTRRIVIASQGSEVTALPVNGTDYLHNASFGLGQEVAPGQFVVFDGTSSSTDVGGLQPATSYYFKVYEYNGTNAATEYIATAPSGNVTTLSAPTTQATSVAISQVTGNSFKINWTAGNGSRRLVLMREGNSVNANPTDLSSYSASSVFGNGSQIGSGNYAVFFGTTNTVTVTGLLPNTTYHVAVFEANGSSSPVYLAINPSVTNATTLVRPSVAPSNLSFSQIDGNEIRLTWTVGNGTRRIVVAREGAPVDALPVDGVDYLTGTSSTASFATATEISPGQKVVYDHSGTSFDCKGLDPATTYYFKVYEYDGTGSTIAYLTSSFASGSQSTVSAPTTQPSNISFSNITSTSMKLNWTAGDGARRLVIAKEDGAVDVSPAQLSLYSAHSNFGSGTHLGNGNYVVGFTTATTITLNALTVNKTYHFAIYEANGSSAPVYNLIDPAVASAATSERPTVPSSALSFSQIDGNSMRISWTIGNGARRIIIARAGSPVDAVPTDGVDYLPVSSTSFTAAPEISAGQKVIYDNTGGFMDLSGLETGVTYYFRIYEYSGTGSTIAYLTSSYATGSRETLVAPTIAPSNIVFSNITGNAMTISWTPGNGTRRLVVAREGVAVDAIPTTYSTYSSSTIFGNGAQLGAGNYVVYSSTSNSVTVTGLDINKTYHFAVFEANGSSGIVYNLNAATGSQSTADRPTVSPSNLSFSQLDGTKMRVNWSLGNGERRIVVVRAGAPVDAVPVDGVDYLGTTTSAFNVAPEISAGQKVVYDNIGGFIDLTGLSPNTVYHFRVYEYSGSGSNIAYLTSSFAEASQSTLSVPTVQANNVAFTSVASNSVIVSWTNGNGSNRLVVARQGNAVDVMPADLTSYNSNTVFGNGSQLGAGNYVVYKSTSSNATITNLLPGTTYHFAVFEFNGSDAPVYLVPGSAGQVTTIGPPAVQAGNALPGTVSTGSATLHWTNGSGNKRIVLMKQGSAVDEVPANSIEYFANSFFGSGAEIGDGNYVVFDGLQDFVTVTNLQPGTIYHFAVFEYNDFGATSQVLTTSPATAMVTTGTLPVNFIAFTGVYQNKGVLLKWTTGSEQNSKGFEIERSPNGVDFIKLGAVSAAGFSNSERNYEFTDVNPLEGTSFYRIKQLDDDGSFIYSKIIRINIRLTSMVQQLVQTSHNELVIDLRKQPSTAGTVKLYDAAGRLVKDVKAAGKQIRVETGSLKTGIYILELLVDGNRETIKIGKR